MAMAARAFHLAIIGLALLHLLAQATTAENLHISSRITTATTLPSRGFVFPLGSDARPAAAGAAYLLPPPPRALHVRRHGRRRRAARPRRLHHGGTGRHRGGTHSARRRLRPLWACSTSATSPSSPTAFTPSLHLRPSPTSPLRRVLGVSAAAPGGCTLSTRATAAVDAPEAAAPQLGATTKALLHAGLPLLLAVPFLPAPVSALVVLSSLVTPARARSDDCYKLHLHHATCTVYPYDNETGFVDRARPDPELGKVCLHPLCHADSADRLLSSLHAQRRGRGDDILYVYCAVRTLEGAPSILPWRNTWSVHLPVADPRAAAASGGDICYVELAHLGYTEGYYIHCTVAEHRQTYCTEFPDEAIAAAVWEHRRLNYRDTAGPRYATYQAKYGEL
ncbi:unnamed protein product [Urochloa decumbens]|uniref:Uncharacterized protein n=1 Tax=Urochloa decumbens TaxID=240449 RepID=A0ABC9BK00_9POAL